MEEPKTDWPGRITIGVAMFGVGAIAGFAVCCWTFAADMQSHWDRGFNDARRIYDQDSQGNKRPMAVNQSGSSSTPP